MSYEEFEDDTFTIAELVMDMHFLVDECMENKYKIYTKEDQNIVQERMDMLLKQGTFWILRDNKERYIYDLNEFNVETAETIKHAINKIISNEVPGRILICGSFYMYKEVSKLLK